MHLKLLILAVLGVSLGLTSAHEEHWEKKKEKLHNAVDKTKDFIDKSVEGTTNTTKHIIDTVVDGGKEFFHKFDKKAKDKESNGGTYSVAPGTIFIQVPSKSTGGQDFIPYPTQTSTQIPQYPQIITQVPQPPPVLCMCDLSANCCSCPDSQNPSHYVTIQVIKNNVPSSPNPSVQVNYPLGQPNYYNPSYHQPNYSPSQNTIPSHQPNLPQYIKHTYQPSQTIESNKVNYPNYQLPNYPPNYVTPSNPTYQLPNNPPNFVTSNNPTYQLPNNPPNFVTSSNPSYQSPNNPSNFITSSNTPYVPQVPVSNFNNNPPNFVTSSNPNYQLPNNPSNFITSSNTPYLPQVPGSNFNSFEPTPQRAYNQADPNNLYESSQPSSRLSDSYNSGGSSVPNGVPQSTVPAVSTGSQLVYSPSGSDVQQLPHQQPYVDTSSQASFNYPPQQPPIGQPILNNNSSPSS